MRLLSDFVSLKAQPSESIFKPNQRDQLTEEDKFDDKIRYNIFCIFWAVATLFHMAQSRTYTSELHYVFLTLSAIALILRPSSTLRLVLLIIFQLYEVFFRLPDISNHWIFTVFVSLTILQVLFYLFIKKNTFIIDKSDFIKTFTPIACIELLLLYFFVVLHKLNWDFFSPVASCAAVLFKAQLGESFLPTSTNFLIANIYSTIIIESLIPILLIFRKIRNIGLLIGLLFHGIIAFNSFNGFYDFSSMIFAVYFLFTSYSFSRLIYSFYKKSISKWNELKIYFIHFNFIVLFALCLVFLIATILFRIVSKQFYDYFHVLWAVYILVFIGLFILSLFKSSPYRIIKILSVQNFALCLFPLLVFINGISPYLGLKTESSFAMFSNLRTEGGITNHFFIPASTQIFDFQKDMIEVVSSSDPNLQSLADKDKLITYFQLKNYTATTAPEHLVYLRDGKMFSFALATASPKHDLLRKSSPILRKLLRFRAINKTGPQPCQH